MFNKIKQLFKNMFSTSSKTKISALEERIKHLEAIHLTLMKKLLSQQTPINAHKEGQDKTKILVVQTKSQDKTLQERLSLLDVGKEPTYH